MKEILQDKTESQIVALMQEYGEKSYRAGQIYRGLMRGKSISQITEISKDLKAKLLENFEDEPIKIIKTFLGQDGTEKYLYELGDGNIIEGVLMKYKYGNTQCVSTQVGCRMNCSFCASGLNGLVRNLTSGEILSQVLKVNQVQGGELKDRRKVTNIVLMGSGEPLDNYDNVIEFLKNVTAENGINVSARNISLSTCGLVPNIYKLAEEGLPVNLTISLHSPFDEERKEIMPIAKAYSIDEILKGCGYYFNKTKRRYIFEYSLIRGKNDGERHADALIKLLKGKPCHINLIRLNEVKERGLSSVTDKDAYRFLGLLEKGGLSATVRRQIGSDIGGACGQLRNSYKKENGDNNDE